MHPGLADPHLLASIHKKALNLYKTDPFAYALNSFGPRFQSFAPEIVDEGVALAAWLVAELRFAYKDSIARSALAKWFIVTGVLGPGLGITDEAQKYARAGPNGSKWSSVTNAEKRCKAAMRTADNLRDEYVSHRLWTTIESNRELCWLWEAWVAVPTRMMSKLCELLYDSCNRAVEDLGPADPRQENTIPIRRCLPLAKHRYIVSSNLTKLQLFLEGFDKLKQCWSTRGFYAVDETDDGPLCVDEILASSDPLKTTLAGLTRDALNNIADVRSMLPTLKRIIDLLADPAPGQLRSTGEWYELVRLVGEVGDQLHEVNDLTLLFRTLLPRLGHDRTEFERLFQTGQNRSTSKLYAN